MTGFKNNILAALLCTLSLPLTIWLWKYTMLLTLSLVLLSGIVLMIKYDMESILIYLAGGVAGPVAEMLAILAGAWTYANPDVLGVPYWLFPLWGIASVFIWCKGLIIRYLLGDPN